MITFKQFLIEELNSKSTKQEIVDVIKKELFGSFDGKEKDTYPEEVELFSYLEQWIGQGGESDNLFKIYELFKILYKVKDTYPQKLKPNLSSYILYRGVYLDNNILNIENIKNSIYNKNTKCLEFKNTIKYICEYEFESWSTKINSVKLFLKDIHKSYPFYKIPIILKYDFKSDKDLLFNPNFMNKVNRNIGIDFYEYEVIRLRNLKTPILCNWYIPVYLLNNVVNINIKQEILKKQSE
jgi:hypothetical protein